MAKSCALVFVLLFHSAVFAGQYEGSFCIGPVFKVPNERGGAFGPSGESLSYEKFFIQIDSGPKTKLSQTDSTDYGRFENHGRHLVKIINDGRIIQSFWFSYDSLGENKACLTYGSFYDTWQLHPYHHRGMFCQCRN